MKIRAFTAFLLTTNAAYAETPNVVTDIAPIHSLVAQVMDGVGTPSLLIKQGASPHGYTLRPSEARALQNADIVFWMGEDLTPWLENAVETLASDAVSLELLHAPGTEILNFRETPVFSADEHHDEEGHDDHGDEHHDEDGHDDHGDEHHDEDGHDDHGDEHDDEDGHDDHGDEHHDEDGHDDHGDEHHDEDGHDDHGDEHHDEDGHDDHGDEHHDEDGHDDHGDEHHDEDGHDDHAGHDDHSGHDHDGADPHAWLDVNNAETWVNVIASSLSDLDPANAAIYAANAAKASESLEALEGSLSAQLAPYADAKFIVFHDAYQYLEHSMGLQASGALQLSDATPPSAARLDAIRHEIEEHNITCVFSEPQFSDALVTSVTNGELASSSLDPLGFDLDVGTGLYGALLQNLADSIKTCLK